MRERTVVPILLIVSIVLIALFFVVTPNYITENGDVKHFEDNDLSFDMLKSWTVYEYDDPIKIPFLSSSPDSILLNPVDSSQFSMSNSSAEDLGSDGEVINTGTTNAFDVIIVKTEITKHDSLPEGVTLNDAYKADSLYNLMSSTGQFNLQNDTAMTIDGQNAHQFKYTVSSMTYLDTWVEKDGHYIRVLSQVASGFYDEVEPQFNTIINTLKVK